MMKWLKKCKSGLLLAMMLMLVCGMNIWASQDDNSLYSLGIQNEGAVVSPEFSYDVWSYTVTVPAGTTELYLDPVPSSESASISDISGTVLDENGKGYVTITVQAGDGSTFTYELNVSSDGAAAAETEKETEAQTEKETETEAQTEPATEDSQYVKVDKNSLQEAENTITDLKGQITTYKDKVNLYTLILYVLIALAIILLFIVINLLLRRKDMKAELNDYRSYGYSNNKKAQKQEVKQQKKEQKDQKKQKSQKAPKNQSVSYPDDAEFQSFTYGNQSGVKPASMHNAAPGETYAPQQAPGNYSGLDVQPQKSQKKAKKMPQYEPPAMKQQPVRPVPQQQASQMQAPQQQAPQMPQQPAAPAGNAPAAQKGKKDVEVTMIDL